MKLEVATFRVEEVRLASRTRLENRRLDVNESELIDLLAKDRRIKEISLEVAHPGEPTRIIHPLEAVEPMCKLEGASGTFPGILGPVRMAGVGKNRRLKGMAVLVCGTFPEAHQGFLRAMDGLIDMSGPGAPYCTCSDLIDLVVIISPAQNCPNAAFDEAVRLAGLKAARYLAEAVNGGKPDELEIFELTPADPTLPRVVYVNQLQQQGLHARGFYYGQDLEHLQPTLVHPNEILDGALVSGNYKTPMKLSTYLHCNNPAVLKLYDRHGKDLNFVGVIICRGHYSSQILKERSAAHVARLAHLLKADAALLTVEGTGNSLIEYMQTIKACEEVGVKTTGIIHEYGGPDGSDAPLVDGVPEADALVSTGGVDRLIALPPMERIVGGDRVKFSAGQYLDASKGMTVNTTAMFSSFWQMGISGFTCLDY